MRTLRVLTAAAAIAALAGGTSLAQQAGGENGTDANGPLTILKNMAAEPAGVAVTVDGQVVDDLSSVAYDDITTLVHKGQNTLTVRWSGPLQQLNFAIAYAPTRNNFKNVAVVRSDASKDPALRRAGSRTVTFTIPG
jgi:hypothetical protein